MPIKAHEPNQTELTKSNLSKPNLALTIHFDTPLLLRPQYHHHEAIERGGGTDAYSRQFEPLNDTRIGTRGQPCRCDEWGHHKSVCPSLEVHAAAMANHEGRTECGELEEVPQHHATQVLDVWAPGASTHGHAEYGCAGISPKGDLWPHFN